MFFSVVGWWESSSYKNIPSRIFGGPEEPGIQWDLPFLLHFLPKEEEKARKEKSLNIPTGMDRWMGSICGNISRYIYPEVYIKLNGRTFHNAQ